MFNESAKALSEHKDSLVILEVFKPTINILTVTQCHHLLQSLEQHCEEGLLHLCFCLSRTAILPMTYSLKKQKSSVLAIQRSWNLQRQAFRISRTQSLALEKQIINQRGSSSDPQLHLDDNEQHWRTAMESQPEPGKRCTSDEGEPSI